MISLPARQEPPALTRTNELVLDQHEPGLKKQKNKRGTFRSTDSRFPDPA